MKRKPNQGIKIEGISKKLVKIIQPVNRITEKQLNLSEQKFRRLFETAQDGILLLDAKTSAITEANPFITKLLGYSHAEMIGKKLWDIGSFKDLAASKKTFKELQKRKTIRYENLPLQTKSGEIRNVEFVSNIYRVGENKVIQCNIRDITDRKIIGDEMRENESRFRELFNRMSSCVAVYEAVENGRDFIFKDFNASAELVEKISRQKVMGRKVTEVFPGIREMGLLNTFQEVWKTGKAKSHPVSIYKDNHVFGWRENFIYKLPSGEIVAIYEDVTDRKRKETALQVMSDTQRQLVQLEKLTDIYQLVGNRIQELIGDGYVIISELDEPLQLIHSAGLFGFGSGIDNLVQRFHIDPSKMTYPLKDIRPDELRLFQSGKLEKFPGGFYSLLLRKVPKSICRVAEKKLAISEFYTMGFIRHGNHYGGVTILTKNDITINIPFIEIVIQQASTAINRIRSDLELHESEKRFRSLYENATVGMYRTTPDGRILLANPALVRMLGYPSFEELAKRNLEKDGYETGYSRQDFQKQIELEGELYGIESAWKRKDGSAIFVRESAKAIREQNGKVIYYEGTVEDISERRNAENAIRDSEVRYRNLFEDSPIALWEEDHSEVKNYLDKLKLKGITNFRDYFNNHIQEVRKCLNLIKILNINNATLKLYNAKDKSEIINGLSTVFTESALTNFIEQLIRIANGEKSMDQEIREEKITGEKMINHIYWHVAPGYEDSLSRVLVSIIDTTERHNAEIALHESEAHFRGLFENSPISLWEEDFSKVKKHLDELKKRGISDIPSYLESHPKEVAHCVSLIRVLDVNTAALKLFQTNNKADLLQPISSVLSTQALDEFREELNFIIEGRSNFELETRSQTMTGKPMVISLSGSVAPGHESDLSKVFISMIDITDRKRAEENIRHSEEDLKKAQSVAHVGSWRWDIKNNNLTWSDEMYRIFGIAKEKFTGVLADVMAQVIHPEDRPAVEASNISVMRDKKPIPLEYRVVWPDKSIHWVWAEAGELILDDKGESAVLSGFVQEITERKLAVEKLRSSELKYRTLTEQAADGIFQLNPDGKFIYANTRFCEMLGYSQEEIITLTIYDTYLQKEIEEGKKRVAKINKGSSLHFERLMVTKNGRSFPVEIHSNKLSSGNMQSICRDISERKQKDEAIRKHAHLQENMASLGHALTSTLDLQEIYRISYKYLEKMIDCSNFGITLFDPKKADLQATYLISDGVEMDINLLPPLKYNPDHSSSGRSKAIATQSPIIIRDLESKRKASGGNLIGSSREPQSAIYVPMLVEGKVLGLLDLQSYEADAYLQEDGDWLSVIANQIGLNIQNAFLYQSLQKELKERTLAEQRQKDLAEEEHKQRIFSEALTKNALNLNSTLKTEELLDAIIDNIHSVIPFEAVNIIMIEQGHGKIVRSKGFAEKGYLTYLEKNITDFSKYHSFRQMIDSGSYVVIPDTRIDPNWIFNEKAPWKIISTVQAPIIEDKQVIGFLTLNSSIPDFYNEDHAQQLMAFTDQVSNALKNARLFENTQRRMKRMNAMTLIDQAINSSLDIHVSLELVLMQSLEQLGADASDILLANYASNTLTFGKAKGFRTNEISKSNLSLGAGLSGQAVLERKTISIPDLKSAPESFFRDSLINKEGFVSYYCVPLITKGLLKGIMEVYFRKLFEADTEWLEFLETLAQQTAIAINNAELLNSLQISNNDLKNAYDSTLQGWVEALDLRDKENEGHSLRVTDSTLRLVLLMNVEDKEITNIKRGALLHDIGKISISDSILNKPGPLSEEEWTIMRKHPEFAFQLLSKTSYLRDSLDIPYCHHEKWDGSGYPRGLKGESIPLAARIFAVVDVWDALTSNRPYRSAWSKEKALDYIQEQGGMHFDPQVVAVFVKNLKALNLNQE